VAAAVPVPRLQNSWPVQMGMGFQLVLAAVYLGLGSTCGVLDWRPMDQLKASFFTNERASGCSSACAKVTVQLARADGFRLSAWVAVDVGLGSTCGVLDW
jgi:hypothetical protein